MNEALQQSILEKALSHIPFDGWTMDMLRQSALDAGYEVGYEEIAFPGGVEEAVEAYARWFDLKMLESLKEQEVSSLKIREKIAVHVRARISLQNPAVVQQTLSYFSLPVRAPQAMQSLFKTVDLIWQQCGDISTDYNYYTKRTLLAGVYTTTLLYWLDDHSDEYQQSWAFLDRRIENVLQIGKAKQWFYDKIGAMCP